MKMKTSSDVKKILDNIPVSRRTLLKLGGVAGLSAFVASQLYEECSAQSSVRSKIVIVGGGAGGCSIANYLSRKLEHPDITIIEPNPHSVSYQPGQTLIGAGIWKLDDIRAKSSDFFPDGVTWVKDSVCEFHPDNNLLITSGNQKIIYDFLVVTTGIQLNYNLIEGIDRHSIGKNGIASIYTGEGAVQTWNLLKKFIEKSITKFQTAVYTHPNTPIKCAGAPKKILFLSDDRLRKEGNRDNTDMAFYAAGSRLFDIAEFETVIQKQFIDKKASYHLKHDLVAVEPEKREAFFEYSYTVKGDYDADLEEYELVTKKEIKKVKYDFLHITPPMSAPDAVKKSQLSWQKGDAKEGGWVEVFYETLQHRRYENIFSFGDVAGLPFAKTGGSVRQQYKVVGQNIISLMEGKEPAAKYNGYTVCPITTEVGKVIMAEFDWSGKPTPCLPIDPVIARRFWWFVKLHLLKPLCYYGMYKGIA